MLRLILNIIPDCKPESETVDFEEAIINAIRDFFCKMKFTDVIFILTAVAEERLKVLDY